MIAHVRARDKVINNDCDVHLREGSAAGNYIVQLHEGFLEGIVLCVRTNSRE